MVAQKFPRGRGIRRRTIEERNSIATFDATNAMYYLLTAEERESVREAVKGTQWLARDLHTVLMYGTFFLFSRPDGRLIYPMAYNSEVSQALDALGFEVGSILIRTEDGWRAIEPGTSGQVLTSNGPGMPPTWENP